MKRSCSIGAIAGFLLSGTGTATVSPYRAVLNGEQLVPPAVSVATGDADLEFDDATRKLSGIVKYRGLGDAPSGAAIHHGTCGANGDVAIPLAAPGATETTVDATLNEAEEAALVAGNLHIIVRTPVHADGEIRGQLYYPRPPRLCLSAGRDAGSDAGSDGGFTPRQGFPSSAPSSTGPAPAGPWSGVSSPPTVPGTAASGAARIETGGCSTSASPRGNLLGIAFAMAVIARCRRKNARGVLLIRRGRADLP